MLNIVSSRSELLVASSELSNDPIWVDVALKPSDVYNVVFRIARDTSEVGHAAVVLFEVEGDDDQPRNAWGVLSPVFGLARYRHLPPAGPDNLVVIKITGPVSGRVRIGLRTYRNKAPVTYSATLALERLQEPARVSLPASESARLHSRIKAAELYLESGTTGSIPISSSFLRSMVPKRILQWKERIIWISAHHQLKTGKHLRLLRPVLFSDKMQWRKLFDANQLYTKLSDKIAVQDYIKLHGFEKHLVPTLWIGIDPNCVPIDEIPRPFVLKSTHASGQVIFVENDTVITAAEVTEKCNKWLQKNFGLTHMVPGYVHVPMRLIAEPMLKCIDGKPPIEMKVFVFDGVVKYLQHIVTLDDGKRTRIVRYLTPTWEKLPWNTRAPTSEDTPSEPSCLKDIIRIAEALCRRLDHCRVDFYVRDDDIFVGELTLYSWAGWFLFKQPEVDGIMGSYWNLKWPALRAMWAILFKRWGEP